MTADTRQLLHELALAKAAFQLRAIETVLGLNNDRTERVLRMGEIAKRLNEESRGECK